MSSISHMSSDAAIESVLAAKEAATQTKIAYAVAAKMQGAHRAAGDAALALLDAAAPRGAAEGKGANLDVSA
ncbi:hypothetical protein [Botrimarina mediterranea]|uniref:Motility protein n=1 Tax=Botrimarina mediterranea TaxID=2528022 RepID=A0A518K5L1_9BACT|nr:hypothetical protein [Botrimarina mediterranea]QDV73080.1 hypothetical protein Spa11_12690 [Botrimarina mediterranea]QDV77633.1 hypothetical protein K2D_12310 [Planctomycetes bacterium K2D]